MPWGKTALSRRWRQVTCFNTFANTRPVWRKRVTVTVLSSSFRRFDTTGPDQGAINWMVADLAALWITQIRTTKPETYGDFIANDMRLGGQMGDELEAIKAKLDEEINPVSKWLPVGRLFPRRAFEKAVLQKLRNKDTCFAFLMEIVHT